MEFIMNVEDTLAQRGKVHGDYTESSIVKDEILAAIECTPNWRKMSPGGREALRMIVEKIGRIMVGDWKFADHWHDIAGYATLMENEIHQYAKGE